MFTRFYWKNSELSACHRLSSPAIPISKKYELIVICKPPGWDLLSLDYGLGTWMPSLCTNIFCVFYGLDCICILEFGCGEESWSASFGVPKLWGGCAGFPSAFFFTACLAHDISALLVWSSNIDFFIVDPIWNSHKGIRGKKGIAQIRVLICIICPSESS